MGVSPLSGDLAVWSRDLLLTSVVRALLLSMLEAGGRVGRITFVRLQEGKGGTSICLCLFLTLGLSVSSWQDRGKAGKLCPLADPSLNGLLL